MSNQLEPYIGRNEHRGGVSSAYLFFCFCTAMVGKSIHGSIAWSVVDAILAPVVWVKWIYMGEVCMSLIADTFAPFFS